MAVGPLEVLQHPYLKKLQPHLRFEFYFSVNVILVSLKPSYQKALKLQKNEGNVASF